jgi:hypothetical protein
MGQIDVTDVLADPDMVDPVVLTHRIPTVDNYGSNQLTEEAVNTFGSVQSVSGKTLARLPDEYRVANVMSFWIRGKIIADGKNRYPDLICFNGERYAVQAVFDWTNWGAGWCEGTCVREKPTQ